MGALRPLLSSSLLTAGVCGLIHENVSEKSREPGITTRTCTFSPRSDWIDLGKHTLFLLLVTSSDLVKIPI